MPRLGREWVEAFMSNPSHIQVVTKGPQVDDECGSDLPVVTHPFRFESAYRRAGLVFGIGPHSARLTVGHSQFAARFGPWKVRTPLNNIAGTTRTGPYR